MRWSARRRAFANPLGPVRRRGSEIFRYDRLARRRPDVFAAAAHGRRGRHELGWPRGPRCPLSAASLIVREPIEQWSVGRVTLLGDACHPTLPMLAQGAVMPIEDGFVLARCFERWSADVATALDRYERARKRTHTGDRPRFCRRRPGGSTIPHSPTRSAPRSAKSTDSWGISARSLRW